MHSILNGFLTGSKWLPEKDAYKSCAHCISDEQKSVDGTAQTAFRPSLYISRERLHEHNQMQQYAVNNCPLIEFVNVEN
jgi:hypothetical protein